MAPASRWPSPWPAKLKQDDTPRPQFHHVIDIAPTLYEILDITPPRTVNGIPQDSIDGTSMLYTFDDPEAEGRRTTQFFDIMGSRGIYHDGWFAGTFGPREPWTPGAPPGIMEWNPENDVWELYNLEEDWSQANDLAAEMPEKVNELKDLFLVESTKNDNLPIGGGLWTVLFDPTSAPSTPYRDWTFRGRMERMPEFAAPKLGKADTRRADRGDGSGERERRPLRARRILGPGSPSSWRTATSSTSTTSSKSSGPACEASRRSPRATW